MICGLETAPPEGACSASRARPSPGLGQTGAGSTVGRSWRFARTHRALPARMARRSARCSGAASRLARARSRPIPSQQYGLFAPDDDSIELGDRFPNCTWPEWGRKRTSGEADRRQRHSGRERRAAMRLARRGIGWTGKPTICSWHPTLHHAGARPSSCHLPLQGSAAPFVLRDDSLRALGARGVADLSRQRCVSRSGHAARPANLLPNRRDIRIGIGDVGAGAEMRRGAVGAPDLNSVHWSRSSAACGKHIRPITRR